MIRPRFYVAAYVNQSKRFMRQSVQRVVRSIPFKAYAYVAGFGLLFAVESLPGFMALAEQEPAAKPVQHSDSDKPERKRPSIVNNSDDGPTIHFSRCRENDKGHVSCSFEDADGNQHWVYLAGYKLPASK